MGQENDRLLLGDQLCFPLYACAKEMIRSYQPELDALGLTYTQFIVMIVLWEHKSMNVKALGEYLYLDSGTLTPLLRKLEVKGFLKRERSKVDERTVDITITEEGIALEQKAVNIPYEVRCSLGLKPEEMEAFRKGLYDILARLREMNDKR